MKGNIMENKAFEKFKGVTVLTHQPARKVNNDFWHRISSTACGLAMTALFFWLLLQFIMFAFVSEQEAFHWVKFLATAVAGLVFCLVGYNISPRWEPERYELKISEDCSAVSFFEIQANWDLKQGPEPGVWVATSKSDLKNLPKREW